MDQQILEEYFAAHREEMIADICRLVAIPSDRGAAKPGMPYGEGPAKALEEAMDIAADWGFAVSNYDNYVCTADLDPTLPTELDILAHLDVVPVSDGWTVTAPFVPLLKDGKIYGRGTADDKGPAIAALYAMRAVKELGVPLSKNVRLILGTDEECGSSDLEYYYQKEKEAPKSFSPDASFPVINLEKGGLRGAFSAEWPEDTALPRLISADGGTKLNVVPDKASALFEGLNQGVLEAACQKAAEETQAAFTVSQEGNFLRVNAKGVSAHASTPQEGVNAVTALLRLIVALPLAESQGFARLKAVEALFPHGDYLGKAAGTAMKDDLSGETTISFDIFHYTATGLKGEFDCRACILANDENLRDVIQDRLAAGGVTLAPCSVFAAHHVPAESPFIQTLLSCYEKFTGKKGYCVSIGGGTYVHHLKNGVAFGCEEIGVNNHMHGDDEFVIVDQLILSAKIFAEAIARICG